MPGLRNDEENSFISITHRTVLPEPDDGRSSAPVEHRRKWVVRLMDPGGGSCGPGRRSRQPRPVYIHTNKCNTRLYERCIQINGFLRCAGLRYSSVPSSESLGRALAERIACSAFAMRCQPRFFRTRRAGRASQTPFIRAWPRFVSRERAAEREGRIVGEPNGSITPLPGAMIDGASRRGIRKTTRDDASRAELEREELRAGVICSR